jgi:hypothetical protein
MHSWQVALVALVRWWEGGGKAENLDGQQDAYTGASSSSTTVSITYQAQMDMIQRTRGGGRMCFDGWQWQLNDAVAEVEVPRALERTAVFAGQAPPD